MSMANDSTATTAVDTATISVLTAEDFVGIQLLGFDVTAYDTAALRPDMIICDRSKSVLFIN